MNSDLFETDEKSAAIDALHAMTALYTNSPIVDDLLDRIGWPDQNGKLLDPSAGDGMFIVRALARLKIRKDTPVDLERVLGWEIHPHAVAAGRARISEFLQNQGWTLGTANAAARSILVEADFVLQKPTGEFRFIAGNPPFAVFRNLPDYFKTVYGATLPRHSRADLLHAFLDACVNLMPVKNGVIGMVTSDRWLMNSGAAQLREHISRSAGIKHIERLDPTTAFYRPKNRKKGTPPRIHPVAVVITPPDQNTVEITSKPMSPDGAQDTWEGIRLGDVATVKIAPWLGPHGIFTLSKEQAEKIDAADLIPSINSENIHKNDDILLPPTTYAIRTFRDKEPTGAVADHIKSMIHLMPPRGQSGKWWMPPEAINLDLSNPSILIPRIGRRIRCIPLPPGILPTDHNLHVISKTDKISLEQIKKSLLSNETQNWLESFAPRLEGGFFDLRTTFIKTIPVYV